MGSMAESYIVVHKRDESISGLPEWRRVERLRGGRWLSACFAVALGGSALDPRPLVDHVAGERRVTLAIARPPRGASDPPRGTCPAKIYQ